MVEEREERERMVEGNTEGVGEKEGWKVKVIKGLDSGHGERGSFLNFQFWC